jgi:polysaccharide export outer membrane protein
MMLSASRRWITGNQHWLRRVAAGFFVALALITELHAQIASSTADQHQNSNAGATASPSSNRSAAPSVAPQDVSNLKLMPGSMIDLHVFEEPDLDGSYRLDKQGDISLPLAGLVQLESLTLREAELAIQSKLLSSEVLKVANVAVNLNEYSTLNVVVMGEVTTPGTFPIIGPRKLIEVLSLAGGETALAGNEIVIQRAGQPLAAGEVIRYNRNGRDSAPLSVVVNPGDTVVVKKAGIVYVLGAVTRPGGYVMQEAGELNVDQALAMAAGTIIEAKIQDIRVFRKMDDGSMVEIPVNYKKINSGKATPLRLQAQDVVYVPISGVKETILRAGTQVANAAASAFIYSTY